MKCQVCFEELLSHVDLFTHFHEKHVNPIGAALEKLYSNTDNKWFDQVRANQTGRRSIPFGRAPQMSSNIVYFTDNNLNGNDACNVEEMIGRGMSNNEPHRWPKNYTHKELRAILRFHKYFSNK